MPLHRTGWHKTWHRGIRHKDLHVLSLLTEACPGDTGVGLHKQGTLTFLPLQGHAPKFLRIHLNKQEKLGRGSGVFRGLNLPRVGRIQPLKSLEHLCAMA